MLKEKIEKWLASSKCSRQEFADKLNVSRRTIDAWLAPKGRPIPKKMHKPIEELILPKKALQSLSPAEKEFFSIEDKISREFWLQEKLEQILVLAHRAMTCWDAQYTSRSDDSGFYEEVTDITQEIRDISSDVTALGAHHADSIIFDEFDEFGEIAKDER